ncbi:2-amino-4-hydroxy-6-hydroxymethyldihydropteridine diphosphokinase [Reinekea sp.]|jgi:2-amino-4-hydroxy-6-hydroxymethyldihydropteridine diphosphokinase|uniref:2-amino-4-hydroxy-6- hydroxymethyldihydropteridine diphosphokinase n=1 Tax=Reinekea sp. TaxID=1970455 RepID=UPI00398982C5
MSRSVYIALGSNLENPVSQLNAALDNLSSLPASQLKQISSLYRSTAVGGPDNQPDYINAACLIKTNLESLDLLKALQSIEKNAGRVRDIRWGPRTLDLDIIWVEGETSSDPVLTLPHPRAHERAFVIQPLLELGATFFLENQSLEHWNRLTGQQSIAKIA